MAIFSIYAFLMLACIFASIVIFIKSAFAGILIANLFSTACAFLYFFLNAPDVSMTEVAIGVFLSTAFLVMTARITREESFDFPRTPKIIFSIIAFMALFFCIYSAILTLGEFGNLENIIQASGGFYLLSSYKEYGIANVITTTLGSFRGFDTMGEAIIIFTASIGVFLILQIKGSRFNSLT